MIVKQAELFNDRDKRLMGKYLVGGAAAGGSLALATSLMNYYRMLKEEADAASNTSDDDNVLYLTMGNANANAPKKVKGTAAAQKEKMASLSGGVAITGGALGAMGSYALVRHMYQKYKKKRLQQQLDEAQQAFFDTASQEAATMKRAAATGKPMGSLEFMTSMPVTMTLLAALASGAITSRVLDKTFPAPAPPTAGGPKKVVLRKQDEPSFYDTVEEEETEEENIQKAGSYDSRSEDDSYKDGLEYVVHLCMANEKVASVSDLHTLVGAVLEGRKEEFIENYMTLGLDAAMDLCKGAQENVKSASKVDLALAIGHCVQTPELSPLTALLAAGEYEDMAPHFCKAAGSQPSHVKELLVKIAGVLGAFGRNQIFGNATLRVKQANVNPGNLEQLLMLIEEVKAHRGGTPGVSNALDDNSPEEKQTLMSVDSESSEEAMGEKIHDTDKVNPKSKSQNSIKPVSVEADPKDEIDRALTGAMS
jgi:hypothetical protein